MSTFAPLLLALALVAPVGDTPGQALAFGPGFTFVGLTVTPDDPFGSADLLANPRIEQVFRFDPAAQAFTFQMRLAGGTLFGAPFTLAPGEGVVVKATEATSRFVAGAPLPADRGFTLDRAGFHLVATPADGVGIRRLVEAHAGLESAFRWNPDAQAFDFALRLPAGFFGVDAMCRSGDALFLRAGSPVVVRFAESPLAVRADPPPGVFTAPPSVTLSAVTPGALIRYTLDGSEPSATAGAFYNAPVTLPGTVVLKACAVVDGTAGPPLRAAYLVEAPVPAESLPEYATVSDNETALAALVQHAAAQDACLAAAAALMTGRGTRPLFAADLPGTAADFLALARAQARAAATHAAKERALEWLSARAGAQLYGQGAPRRFIKSAKAFFYDWAFGSRRRNRERILATVADIRVTKPADVYARALADLHAVAAAKFGALKVGADPDTMLERLAAGDLDVESAQLLSNFSTAGIDAYAESAERLSLRPVDVAFREGAEGLTKGGEFYVDAATEIVGAKYPLLKESIDKTRETYDQITGKAEYDTVTGSAEWLERVFAKDPGGGLARPDPALLEARLGGFLRELKRREGETVPGTGVLLLDGADGGEVIGMIAFRPDGGIDLKPDAPLPWDPATVPFRLDPGTVEFVILGNAAGGNRLAVVPAFPVTEGGNGYLPTRFDFRPSLAKLNLVGPERPAVYPTGTFDLASILASAEYATGEKRPAEPTWSLDPGSPGSLSGTVYTAGPAPGRVALTAAVEEYGKRVEAPFTFDVLAPRLACSPSALYTFVTVGFDLGFVGVTLEGTDTAVEAVFRKVSGPGSLAGGHFEPGETPGTASLLAEGNWAGFVCSGPLSIDVRAFPGLTLSTAAVKLKPGGVFSLDGVKGYATGTTLEVPLQWRLVSGGGAVADGVYTAPGGAAAATLQASYVKGNVNAQTSLIVTVVAPVALDLVPPAARIRLNESIPLGQVAAVVTYSDGETAEVAETWSVPASGYAPDVPGNYEPVASWSESGVTVTRTFGLTVAPSFGEREPNDGPDQAMAIPLERTIECFLDVGGLFSPDDSQDNEDWFSLELPSDARLTFRLAPRPMEPSQFLRDVSCIYVDLHDASRNRFITAEKPMNSDGTVDPARRISLALPAGTYRFRFGFSGFLGFLAYEFSVVPTFASFSAGPEPNDSMETATPLTLNGMVEGHLGFARNDLVTFDNEDWYVVTTGGEAVNYRLRLTCDPSFEQGITFTLFYLQPGGTLYAMPMNSAYQTRTVVDGYDVVDQHEPPHWIDWSEKLKEWDNGEWLGANGTYYVMVSRYVSNSVKPFGGYRLYLGQP